MMNAKNGRFAFSCLFWYAVVIKKTGRLWINMNETFIQKYEAYIAELKAPNEQQQEVIRI